MTPLAIIPHDNSPYLEFRIRRFTRRKPWIGASQTPNQNNDDEAACPVV
jgi:hypothetical protein